MRTPSVKDSALNLLARREHSKKELVEKLRARGYESNVEAVIEDLAEKNLQSNERFAESYTRARAAKGYGPLRITEELKLRGVSRDAIQSALQTMDWQIILKSQHEKLQRKYDLNTKDGELKLKRALLQRGFTKLEG